ncbi:MAG: Ppx/GppA phosphatase family protein [Oligoflexales bacterium]
MSSPSQPIAAIDIGTNSVHLLIAKRNEDGHIRILDTDKAVLRLGEDLDADNMLVPAAFDKTIKALKQMQAIASSYQPVYRVVATHATRSARNHRDFFQKIYDESGIHVSLIDGEEEARLVSLGMQEGLALKGKTFLGVDIGGGSTEIIICQDHRVSLVRSLELGAVSLNKSFLKGRSIKKEHIKNLEHEVQLKLGPLCEHVSKLKFDCAVICSGAAKTLAQMHSQEFQEKKLDDANGYHLKVEEIKQLTNSLHKLRNPKQIKDRWHLDEDRAHIILAGSSILNQISKLFAVDEWIISGYGLREGLVLDTIARLHGPQTKGFDDIRWKNILALGKKYEINQDYAKQVSKLALEIFDQLGKIRPSYTKEASGVQISDRGILKAAAWLHECGKSISYSKYHKHSLYLIANSRLMGFSQKERQMIGLVARFHRKGKANLKHYDCRELSGKNCKRINFLASILRIAAAANRTRQGHITSIELHQIDRSLEFVFQTGSQHAPEVDLYKICKEKKFFEETIDHTVLLKTEYKENVELQKT